MASGVRLEPELEQRLDRVAIAQSVQRFGDDDEARRQSPLIAESCNTANWSEHVPGWEDWTSFT
jgi:predicted transcriptional regulator